MIYNIIDKLIWIESTWSITKIGDWKGEWRFPGSVTSLTPSHSLNTFSVLSKALLQFRFRVCKTLGKVIQCNTLLHHNECAKKHTAFHWNWKIITSGQFDSFTKLFTWHKQWQSSFLQIKLKVILNSTAILIWLNSSDKKEIKKSTNYD